MVIYRLTNKANGKIYVGQTRQRLALRIGDHVRYTRRPKQAPITRAIAKYGIGGFVIDVLEECSSLEDLQAAEKRWIAALNCLLPNGYNCTTGGEAYTSHPDTNAARSRALRGYKWPASRNAAISAALKGRPMTWAAKVVAARRWWKPTDEQKRRACANLHKGPCTPEMREKMSRNNGRRRLSDEQLVRIHEMWATGEYTQQQIADLMGVAQTSISRVLLRQTFKWRTGA